MNIENARGANIEGHLAEKEMTKYSMQKTEWSYDYSSLNGISAMLNVMGFHGETIVGVLDGHSVKEIVLDSGENSTRIQMKDGSITIFNYLPPQSSLREKINQTLDEENSQTLISKGEWFEEEEEKT